MFKWIIFYGYVFKRNLITFKRYTCLVMTTLVKIIRIIVVFSLIMTLRETTRFDNKPLVFLLEGYSK